MKTELQQVQLNKTITTLQEAALNMGQALFVLSSALTHLRSSNDAPFESAFAMAKVALQDAPELLEELETLKEEIQQHRVG